MSLTTSSPARFRRPRH
uniref:Uncharacterized protein n=1 Tax=Rhizophora mucronata TaxID=61149 RepID=A0A2P2NBU5_RHIMU